jgi:hypothetical protein
MSVYGIAGIDVHKKMLAVVIADVAAEGENTFERHTFRATCPKPASGSGKRHAQQTR